VRFLLVLIIAIGSCVPASAATYGGGAGTTANPYLIYTPAQLNDIGANPGDWVKSFKLMADPNLSGYTGTQFNLIGTVTTKFTGTFDGNRHTISNFTYSTTASREYVALFVYTSSSAVIKDLAFVNARITSGSPSSSLVGLNMGTISRCSANVAISSGLSSAAALVFDNYGPISDCWASGSISGANVSGLVYNQYSGSITRCYAAVAQTAPGWSYGLLQYRSSSSSITGSFWDTTVSGTTQSYGGTGRTTAQMKTISTYTNASWDFINIWSMCGAYYPRLQWTLPVADFVCPDGVSFTDFAYLLNHWQESGCGTTGNCARADLNLSDTVDFADLYVLASRWLQGS
jgi:hypothetical protein